MRGPRLFQQFGRDSLEEPIRSEVFGVERLEQHAESLARAQSVTTETVRGRPLMQRVEENGRVLRETHARIAEAVRDEQWITPAAVWLVDNFHVADEQLREIRDDLPPGYYRELPKLAKGPLAGYPRVYGIAWAFVAHTDSRFDPDMLRRFVQAYQRVQALTIGELWAITITLRVVLVENLRRCADAMVHARAARLEADALADELLGLSGAPPKSTVTALQRFEDAPLDAPFAVELVHRLRDRDPAVTPALLWLRERLAAQGTTPDGIVAREHQRQAAMTVTVRNVITSMRSLSALDWSEFFEGVSLVDEVLREDGTFLRMDFESRDAYRHAIEELARGSRATELEIARQAVQRAARWQHAARDTDDHRAADNPLDGRQAETGYYLVGGGRRAFEQELGFRARPLRRVQRAVIQAGALGYIGSIAVLTALILAVPLLGAAAWGVGAAGLLVLGLLGAIAASDLAIALVNRSVTRLVAPTLLPRLELKGGVPPSLRTMIVVPTLLTSPADVEEHIDRLEVHYLANPDGDVRFALLSDWLDSPTEHANGDEELVAATRQGIDRLNRSHGPAPDGGDRFLLYHRQRLWNPRQRSWMGWERKRGKLHELNRLLRGATDTTFVPTHGAAIVAPADVRYVLTLDSDTRLPIGAVTRLVGTMAHPLNRPRLEPRLRRVVEGYGVLQPRVTPPLPGRSGSLYQHLASGPSGIDPYAAAVSDVYQDLFGEGSFTGKGIYDVDAFEAALEGRVAENTLLSHDLFEGVFARSGLVTDVELFESAPANYAAAAARQHRWARGDWQLLPLIFRAPVPAVGRWKMLDNLRRTLSAPASFLTLVVAWTWPLASPLIWNRFILVTITLPVFLPVIGDLLPRVQGISKRSHARAVGRDLLLAAWQTSFTITMLAHQAWLMAEAIVRTLARLFVTHRRLLEWVTSAQARSRLPSTVSGFYRRMSGGIALVAVAAAVVGWRQPGALTAAVPLLLLWTISPAVAYVISAPRLAARTSTLTPEDARTLRSIARRTWRFFTTFVGAEDRALPPDNFQEDPVAVVAHRTSPTNIGLYLLSVITARDFGWIGTLDAVERIETTLGTLKGLERFRGHFYNWYDSKDGHPLDPPYVSSVDSGNLAGSLLTLANACRELIARPPLGGIALSGLDDTVQVLRESGRSSAERNVRSAKREELEESLNAVSAALRQTPRTWSDYAAQLDAVETAVHAVTALVPEIGEEDREHMGPDLVYWAGALVVDVESRARDLETIIPWARERGAHAGEPMQHLATCPSLAELPGRCATAVHQLSARRSQLAADGAAGQELRTRIDSLIGQVEHSAAAAEALMRRLAAAALDAQAMAQTMEFGFLFDPIRQLFSLGYRAADDSLDPGRYDLLASEARLLSFIAIAKGDVPVSHWFRLGRPLTPAGRDSVLLSWSGSMFEYLMPALVMRTPVGSLLEQTCRLVVSRQMAYGEERGVPWGVSESGYYVRDVAMTYQYSNFGVPGLGLRRGLGEDLVVAPYATALAAMIDPAAAVRNFRALRNAGASGPYGFYEAIDYTPTRLPAGTPFGIVRSYMAHHQGMTLVAIANAL
ncbi:MAG TPA: glucoamylase family protein, partial [Gemmatimonadaceae bacterium]|nr:glucoamylase family protein [Gemmatimonadaceae bacterium]